MTNVICMCRTDWVMKRFMLQHCQDTDIIAVGYF